jgi:hypothetical protein
MVSAKRPEGGAMEKLSAAINQPHLLLDGRGTSSTPPETAGTLLEMATHISEAQEAARQQQGRAIEEAPGTGSALANNSPGGMGLADPVPLRLPVAGLAGKGAGGVESGGGNVKPAVPSGAYSPDEGSLAGGLCRVLYQAGPKAGQGSYEGAEQVEGGGEGGGPASAGNCALHQAQTKFYV